jgi:hypothetical protein
MIHAERYFENLAILAVSGELSGPECMELEEHLGYCSTCARRLIELENASRELFASRQFMGRRRSAPAGMQDRFFERALRAGIPLRGRSAASSYLPILWFASLAVALALAVNVGWKATSGRRLISETSPAVARGDARSPDANVSGSSGQSSYAALKTVASDLHVTQRINMHSLKTRRMQAQRQDVAEPWPNEGVWNKRRVFTLNPSFPPGNAATNGVDDLAASNGFRRISAWNIPGSTLWGSGEDEKPGQRVFQYNATLASIAYFDVHSKFAIKAREADLATENAVKRLDKNRIAPSTNEKE